MGGKVLKEGPSVFGDVAGDCTRADVTAFDPCEDVLCQRKREVNRLPTGDFGGFIWFS